MELTIEAQMSLTKLLMMLLLRGTMYTKNFWVQAVLFALTAIVIHGQDGQSGFISIDCGIPDGSRYTDPATGIDYVSDSEFINSGVSKNISATYQVSSTEKQFLNLRSFPDGKRNCYTLKPAQGKDNKYLIRASFMYGNYDSRSEVPIFDLHLGVDVWDTIKFENETTIVRKEIVHIPSSDYIHVCLIKTGLSMPFISVLELRPLSIIIYPTQNHSLELFARVNFAPKLERLIRYRDDIYDRIWRPLTLPNCTTPSTILIVDNKNDDFMPPSAVMRTANSPSNFTDSLHFFWESDNLSDIYYMYFYFAELQALQATQYRGFYIFINGVIWFDKPVPVDYLSSTTVTSDQFRVTGLPRYDVTLNKTENSTLPPIINAVEVYVVKNFTRSQTDDMDVTAILSIKSMYRVTRNWQGDPCGPQAFIWDGLSCKYDGIKFPRIISLNLSSSQFDGVIAPYISNLTMLEVLDLSNNNLTGKVPEFLAELDSLKVLNLKGNHFSLPYPGKLLKKSEDGVLYLSIDHYPSNNTSPPPRCKRKRKSRIPVIASITGALAVLFLLLITLWMIHRRWKRGMKNVVAGISTLTETALERKKQFTYSDISRITNNFQKVIGEGGLGRVYHGFVEDLQVAVKMLSPSSTPGYKEFQAEANLLMSVHHKNLTALVGYCNDSNYKGIIYEYMSNGDLQQHLSGRSSYVLSWEERLRIATDAAQGLEYLHHGCIPHIIHRDVKSANILLNDRLEAKLSDFGLSRDFPGEGSSHVSTYVAGSSGYLDPEYFSSNRLTEKSDVYSFGIVLLEIVTGRPAVSKKQERMNLMQWTSNMLQKGDMLSTADPRLQGNFNSNSVWKVVELAMACASRNSAKRPDMTSVVIELKECSALEMNDPKVQSNKDSVETFSMSLSFGPQAR